MADPRPNDREAGVAQFALFLDTHLSDRYRFLLGESGGSQKLALLVKPTVEAALVPPAGLGDLIDPWLADVNGDGVVNEYQFARDPLVCRLTLDGRPLEVVVAHLKSNFINQGEGPGRDLFEQQYLAHNVTDLLVGSPYRPETLFGHALVDVPADRRFSAVFDDFVTEEPQKQLLLDHIVVSPAMASGGAGVQKAAGSGRIEHDVWAAHRTGDGSRRDERATDHRPATVVVET